MLRRRQRTTHVRREGTGRVTTAREFGIVGRKTGVQLSQSQRLDENGFDDLNQCWKSDEEKENVSLQPDEAAGLASELFPASPSSVGSPLSAKRLSFDAPEPAPAAPEIDSRLRRLSLKPRSKPKPKSSPSPARVAKPKGKRRKALRSSSEEEDEEVDENDENDEDDVGIVGPEEDFPEHARPSDASEEESFEPLRRSPPAVDASPLVEIESDTDEDRDEDDDNDVDHSEEEPEVAQPQQQQPRQMKKKIAKESSEVASPKKRLKRPMAKWTTKPDAKKRRTARRATLQLVDRARVCGLMQEAGDSEAAAARGGPRRSRRQRFAPVKFYECEQINYGHDAIGLPLVDRKHPIVKLVPTPPPPPKRAGVRRARAAKKRGSDSKATGMGWSDNDDVLQDDESMEFDGIGGFVEAGSAKEKRTQLAVRVLRTQLDSIVMQTPQGEPALAAERVPIGAKLIDRPDVALGIIELPPNGVKQREKAHCTEVFFVASGQRNCVAAQIHSTEFKLSKGDSFVVPAGNKYSVRNTSARRPATLFFSLVKQPPQPPPQPQPQQPQSVSTSLNKRKAASKGKQKGRKAASKSGTKRRS